MISARFFICHDLDFTEIARPDVQIFNQLCQRLQTAGVEVASYTNRASDEGFLPFLRRELPTCQWFLIFQTPGAIHTPEVKTAVDAARERVEQKQMQGVLRFVVYPDEAEELVPEWSAIPTFGATYDYPRAMEKLLLALSLSDEPTDKAGPIAPPQPTAFSPVSADHAQLYAPLDNNLYNKNPYEQTLYSTSTDVAPTHDSLSNQPSITQPSYDTQTSESLLDRPAKPPTRLARLKTEFPLIPVILVLVLVLGILLVTAFSVLPPLHALVAGRQDTQHISIAGGTTSATAPASKTAGLANSTPRLGKTVQPIDIATPTPAPGSTPAAQTPTQAPQPTPTPKPACPPTIQNGSTGTWVTTLQTELNARGITDSNGNQLDVDGIFGPLTESAVKNWQTQEGIDVDGIVGPVTWHTLGNC